MSDIRYPMPIDPAAPPPRFVAPAGVVASADGTWVPIEYAEALVALVGSIRESLADYRAGLKRREHGGVLAGSFVDRVAEILGESAMP